MYTYLLDICKCVIKYLKSNGLVSSLQGSDKKANTIQCFVYTYSLDLCNRDSEYFKLFTQKTIQCHAYKDPLRKQTQYNRMYSHKKNYLIHANKGPTRKPTQMDLCMLCKE